MTQPPKFDFALDALLAQLFRIAQDAYTSKLEKIDLMEKTARKNPLVSKASHRTILATYESVLNPRWTDDKTQPKWLEVRVPYEPENLDEQVLVTLKDSRAYAFSMGTPTWVEDPYPNVSL